jgi:hypothetical protein
VDFRPVAYDKYIFPSKQLHGTYKIGAMRIEFSLGKRQRQFFWKEIWTNSSVIRSQINPNLVELSRNLNVRGRSHELHTLESASWHNTCTVSGLGAIPVYLMNSQKKDWNNATHATTAASTSPIVPSGTGLPQMQKSFKNQTKGIGCIKNWRTGNAVNKHGLAF